MGLDTCGASCLGGCLGRGAESVGARVEGLGGARAAETIAISENSLPTVE